ncbi:MAG: hypothetical protein AABW71_00460 [Nanoarchaeota archaeon]
MGLLDFLTSKRRTKERIALFNYHIFNMEEGVRTINSVRSSNPRSLKQLSQITEIYLKEARHFREKEEKNLTRAQLYQWAIVYSRLELQCSQLNNY